MATKQAISPGKLQPQLKIGESETDQATELDSAILAYLVSRGLTKTVKAFEKEVVGVKQGQAGELQKVWGASKSGSA